MTICYLKKRLSSIACLLLSLHAWCQSGTGEMHLAGVPAPGNTLTITYDPAGSGLVNEQRVYLNLEFLYLKDKTSDTRTYPLRKDGNIWVFSMTVPDHADRIGLLFHNNNGTEDSQRYLIAVDQAECTCKTETDYVFCVRMYAQYGDQHKADSLNDVLRKAFPHGDWLKQRYFQRYTAAPGIDSMQYYLNVLLGTFPGITSEPAYSNDQLYTPVARQCALENNFEKYAWYLHKLSMTVRATLNLEIANVLLGTGKHPEMAEKLAKTGLGQYALSYAAPSVILLPDSIINRRIGRASYVEALTTYAALAYRNGHYQQAVTFARKAAAMTTSDDTRTAELYLKILARTTPPAVALSKMEAHYRSGKVTDDELRPLLQQLYLKVHKTPGQFWHYYRNLNSSLLEAARQRLVKEESHQPAPDFTLSDLDGNAVTLSSLRGKVVVLDFWATWCYYCKKSFPAMQKLIQDYKKDKEVVFLFIDTQERIALPLLKSKLSSYLKNTGYRFPVLLDEKVKDAPDNLVYTAYKITGLPTKIIIGLDGDIHFTDIGYSGSEVDLVATLTSMIEIARRTTDR